MAKYSISAHKNLIKITQKSMKKLPVNERELAVFQENLLPGYSVLQWRESIELYILRHSLFH